MSRPRWTVEGADWPNRDASAFVDAGGLRWHVQTFPAASTGAPVALLLHGTGAATHSWRHLAPLLARDFTVIAPDLPGHGFTTGRPRGGMTMSAMATAVGALMAALGHDPALIVGHSAGSALAMRMTLDGRSAPQGIVGLSSALLPFPGLAARLFPGLAKALFLNPLAPHAFARMARVSGEAARFLERSTGSQIDAAGLQCYAKLFATSQHCAGALAMMAHWNLASLKHDLGRLAVPVLLVHGTRDAAIPLSNVRAAAERLPKCRLETLAGLGHLAHEEQPETVVRLIGDFAGEKELA